MFLNFEDHMTGFMGNLEEGKVSRQDINGKWDVTLI